MAFYKFSPRPASVSHQSLRITTIVSMQLWTIARIMYWSFCWSCQVSSSLWSNLARVRDIGLFKLCLSNNISESATYSPLELTNDHIWWQQETWETIPSLLWEGILRNATARQNRVTFKQFFQQHAISNSLAARHGSCPLVNHNHMFRLTHWSKGWTLQELWKLPRVPLSWKCVCVPLQPPNFLEYPRAKRMSRNRRLNSTSKGCFQTFNETIYTSSSHFIQSETFISQVSSSSKWINMFGVFLQITFYMKSAQQFP